MLDDFSQIDWIDRLRRKEEGDCLVGVERAEITFSAGQSRIVYVGEIYGDKLWTSEAINKSKNNYLEPHIERLPLTIIADYRVIN